MANSNLTPERKAELKKEILEEIGKSNKKTTKVKSMISGAKKVRTTPRPKPIKATPVSRNKVVKKKEIKQDLEKIIVAPKKLVKKKVIKKTPRKKVVRKAVIKKKISIKDEEPVVVTMPNQVVKRKTEDIIPSQKKAVVQSEFKPRPSITQEPVKPKDIYKPSQKTGSKGMFLWGILAFVVVAIVIYLGVNIFGIYRLGWHTQTSEKLADILQLPAGKINNDTILLSDYFADLKTVEKVLQSAPEDQLPSKEDLQQQLFARLASIAIVKKELKRYGKEVTDEMIETELQNMIAQSGSIEKTIADVDRLYGMDLDMFKENVIKTLLSIDMLKLLILQDESLEINKQAIIIADQALMLATQKGVDFEALSIQYTNDEGVASTNGDIGWVKRGELPVAVENILFSLSGGDVYGEIFKDEFGYRIFKVESKLVNEETGEESIKLRQIFIKLDVNMYVKSLLDNAVMKKYIQ